MATSTGNKSEKKTKTLSKANKKKVVKSKREAVRTASKTTLRTVKKKTVAKKAAARPKEKPEGHAPHSARITANKGPIRALASRTQFLAVVSTVRLSNAASMAATRPSRASIRAAWARATACRATTQ